MARGNCIVVSANPLGRFVEGIIASGETPSPGQIVQPDPTIALKQGRQTWKIYNADADGGRPKGPFIVLREDALQGKTTADAYAAGARAFGYIPVAGDELNLLIANVSGTATINAGDMLIVQDTSGKMIVTASTPETEVAQINEAIVDNAADQLGWCTWTGY